ncbi:vacuolar ATP synthase subunit C [Actinidia rufa]|uniref:V-type proton ATPase subunit C n=1 Tax=Actinidia rufa TaxID=165716 RepID=A0A7J0GB33_9ERIC|nr:vacuolar ATP synthase subunit C [Actinidia rufa]
MISSSLTVDGIPVDSYLTRFVWEEAKYPTLSPLKEIVDGIHVQVAKIEEDLKVNLSIRKDDIEMSLVLILWETEWILK